MSAPTEDYVADAPHHLCGLPMVRNPHPDAGNPGMAGIEIGYVWECVPCLVKSRHAWAARAQGAEVELAAAREQIARYEAESRFAAAHSQEDDRG